MRCWPYLCSLLKLSICCLMWLFVLTWWIISVLVEHVAKTIRLFFLFVSWLAVMKLPLFSLPLLYCTDVFTYFAWLVLLSRPRGRVLSLLLDNSIIFLLRQFSFGDICLFLCFLSDVRHLHIKQGSNQGQVETPAAFTGPKGALEYLLARCDVFDQKYES